MTERTRPNVKVKYRNIVARSRFVKVRTEAFQDAKFAQIIVKET